MASIRSFLVCGLSVALLVAPRPAIGAEFVAGGHSFSDELGGFRLLSASGQGSAADPVVLVEEIDEAAPIRLVIRRQADAAGIWRRSLAPLHLVKVVVNRSVLAWGGFEVELQEIAGKPSTYGDGLSFNQFAAKPPDVSSDAFAHTNRLFEPADRILFENGFVDPDATAQFKLTITDPTPTPTFYLVQDPKLLFSRLPAAGDFASLPD